MPSAADLWRMLEENNRQLEDARGRQRHAGRATAEETAEAKAEIFLLLRIKANLLDLINQQGRGSQGLAPERALPAELASRSSGSGGGSGGGSSTAPARAGGGSSSAGSSTAGPSAPGPHGSGAPDNVPHPGTPRQAERPAASQQQVRRRTSTTTTHDDHSHPPPSTTTGGASAAAGLASEADVLLTLTAPASARHGGGGALRHRKGANSRGRPRPAGDGSQEREQGAGLASPTGSAAGVEGLRGRSPWSLAALLQWGAAPSPSS